ncbi:hypothetical protein RFI_06558, partial [Reticulomyxa filosa]
MSGYEFEHEARYGPSHDYEEYWYENGYEDYPSLTEGGKIRTNEEEEDLLELAVSLSLQTLEQESQQQQQSQQQQPQQQPQQPQQHVEKSKSTTPPLIEDEIKMLDECNWKQRRAKHEKKQMQETTMDVDTKIGKFDWSNLASNAFGYILRFFEFHELCGVLTRVSKMFNKMCVLPESIRHVRIDMRFVHYVLFTREVNVATFSR